MIRLLPLVLVAGCAGDWGNFMYGPGDYLREQYSLPIHSAYEWKDKAHILVSEHSEELCGGAIACAYIGNGKCVVILPYEDEAILAHELNHCAGWKHD